MSNEFYKIKCWSVFKGKLELPWVTSRNSFTLHLVCVAALIFLKYWEHMQSLVFFVLFFFLEEVLSFSCDRLKFLCSLEDPATAPAASAQHCSSIMDMSLQTFIFLWITVGCLSQPENSETSNNLPVHCDFVSKNVCLEFVEETKTLFQASSSCEKKGGRLLKVISNSVKMYLSNITRENNVSNFTWWIGERVQVHHQIPSPSE